MQVQRAASSALLPSTRGRGMAALTARPQSARQQHGRRRGPPPPLSLVAKQQQEQQTVVVDTAADADTAKAGAGPSSGNGSGISNNRGMGSSSISRGAGRLTGAGKELLALEEAKETGRRQWGKQKRFTHARWALHRSSSRYVRHMSGLVGSRIVRSLLPPLLSTGTTATIICAYESMLRDGVLPAWLPSLLMPEVPFDVTSFALSLLLVFRTNSSYDRWLHAVTLWGGIGNRSQDLMRQLLAYSAYAELDGYGSGASSITDDDDGNGGGGGGGQQQQQQARPMLELPPQQQQQQQQRQRQQHQEGVLEQQVSAAAASCRWLMAFARSLKAQLTEDSDLPSDLRRMLSEEEAALLLAAQSKPSFALAVLTELAAAAPVRESQRIRLDENLTFFNDSCGTCERILRTPIPLSYTRHTSRFMVIWLSALPLGLWQTCAWGTVPLTVIIAFLLLGIEEIGVAIEEPFSILPLEELCRQLENDLADLLDQASSSKTAAKEAAAAALVAASRSRNSSSPAAAVLPGIAAGVGGGGSGGASNGVAPFGRGAAGLLPSDAAIFSSLDESENF